MAQKKAAGHELWPFWRDPDRERKSQSVPGRQKKTMCDLYKAPLIVHVERCPLLLTDGCVFPVIVP